MKFSGNSASSIALIMVLLIVFVYCTRDREMIVVKEENEKEDSTSNTTGAKCDSATITWSNYVNQLVQTNCATNSTCHGSGSSNGDYTTYGGLMTKIPEPFQTRVLDLKNMPPTGPLPQSTRDSLQSWLDQGACE